MSYGYSCQIKIKLIIINNNIQNLVKHLRWSVFAKIVNGYNYFHNISCSSSLLYENNMTFFNTGLICIPEVFILCKVRDREFMNREFIQIN